MDSKTMTLSNRENRPSRLLNIFGHAKASLDDSSHSFHVTCQVDEDYGNTATIDNGGFDVNNNCRTRGCNVKRSYCLKHRYFCEDICDSSNTEDEPCCTSDGNYCQIGTTSKAGLEKEKTIHSEVEKCSQSGHCSQHYGRFLNQMESTCGPKSLLHKPYSITQQSWNNSNDAVTGAQYSGQVVRVEGDGRCLFRSLVVDMSKYLQVCDRDDFGRPFRLLEAEEERLFADMLRQQVVTLMRDNLHFYADLEKSIINADQPTSRQNEFCRFRDRLEAMSLPNTMPGDLELNAVAMVLERRILVLSTDLRYITVYGQERFPQSPILCVRYTRLGEDVGHYDAVLLDNPWQLDEVYRKDCEETAPCQDFGKISLDDRAPPDDEHYQGNQRITQESYTRNPVHSSRPPSRYADYGIVTPSRYTDGGIVTPRSSSRSRHVPRSYQKAGQHGGMCRLSGTSGLYGCSRRSRSACHGSTCMHAVLTPRRRIEVDRQTCGVGDEERNNSVSLKENGRKRRHNNTNNSGSPPPKRKAPTSEVSTCSLLNDSNFNHRRHSTHTSNPSTCFREFTKVHRCRPVHKPVYKPVHKPVNKHCGSKRRRGAKTELSSVLKVERKNQKVGKGKKAPRGPGSKVLSSIIPRKRLKRSQDPFFPLSMPVSMCRCMFCGHHVISSCHAWLECLLCGHVAHRVCALGESKPVSPAEEEPDDMYFVCCHCIPS